jgi:hypothetical protein
MTNTPTACCDMPGTSLIDATLPALQILKRHLVAITKRK